MKMKNNHQEDAYFFVCSKGEKSCLERFFCPFFSRRLASLCWRAERIFLAGVFPVGKAARFRSVGAAERFFSFDFRRNRTIYRRFWFCFWDRFSRFSSLFWAILIQRRALLTPFTKVRKELNPQCSLCKAGSLYHWATPAVTMELNSPKWGQTKIFWGKKRKLNFPNRTRPVFFWGTTTIFTLPTNRFSETDFRLIVCRTINQ